MVVPISEAIQDLLAFAIIFFFAWIIYKRTKGEDVDFNLSDKLKGKNTGFEKGKL